MLETGWLSDPTLALVMGIFFGAFTAGFAGFGLAAAAGAFLLHVMEPRVAVPLMMLCSVVAQATGILHLRTSIRFGSALPFAAGGMAGLPVAIVLTQTLDAAAFRSLFGAFLVCYTGWMLMRLALGTRRSRPAPATTALAAGPDARMGQVRLAAPLVGFSAGIVGGLTAMPGALVTVWADATGMDTMQLRGLLQPFILSMQIGALAMLTVASPAITLEASVHLAVAAFPLAIGTACGLFCYDRIDPAAFRLVVLLIVFLSGWSLLLR